MQRKDRKRLKKCPFCGGAAFIEDSHRSFINGQSTKVSFVRCSICNVRSPRFDNNRFGRKDAVELAVKNWNKRFKEE